MDGGEVGTGDEEVEADASEVVMGDEEVPTDDWRQIATLLS